MVLFGWARVGRHRCRGLECEVQGRVGGRRGVLRLVESQEATLPNAALLFYYTSTNLSVLCTAKVLSRCFICVLRWRATHRGKTAVCEQQSAWVWPNIVQVVQML